MDSALKTPARNISIPCSSSFHLNECNQYNVLDFRDSLMLKSLTDFVSEFFCNLFLFIIFITHTAGPDRRRTTQGPKHPVCNKMWSRFTVWSLNTCYMLHDEPGPVSLCLKKIETDRWASLAAVRKLDRSQNLSIQRKRLRH